MPSLEKRLERLESQFRRQSEKTAGWQCPNEWVDFARLCKVRSRSKIINFDPYFYQTELVKQIEQRSVIVAKGRQLGATETFALWALWRAVRDEGFMGLFLSKRQKDTSKIARRVKRAIEGFKGAIRLRTDNICDVEIIGGGRLLFANSGADSVRSTESVTFALFDEASFVPNADEIYTSLGPAIDSGGEDARVAIISTPNGQTGWYWGQLAQNNGSRDVLKELERARASGFESWVDDEGWAKMLIHWRAHPIHQDNPHYLKDVQRRTKLSSAAVSQEYDLNFEVAEQSVFAAGLVQRAITRQPMSQKPSFEEIYYAGLDTSGDGNDYTVLCILRQRGDELEVVHWYRKRRETSDYHLFQIRSILDRWEPIKSGVEKNSMGVVYLEALQRNCPELEFDGISTTATSKAVMIDRLLMLFESGQIKIPEACPLIDELLSFQRKEKKLEAASGKHDDFVMALALAAAVSPFGQDGIQESLFFPN